ncbi:hypothetical protein [[Ruminococcus] lactaris]|nr:hypothetical protein [[Ruminococcus] lactaris]
MELLQKSSLFGRRKLFILSFDITALFYSFLSAGCSSAADMEQQPLSA